MQKEFNEKLIKLLNFLNIKEESISFNKDFNVYLIYIKTDQTLNKDFCLSLEYIINQISPKDLFIKIDADGRFSKQLDSIKDEIHTIFNQSKYYNKPIGLKPKNAFERRLAHIYIDSMYGVRHESIGEGDNRQIIIYPN